MDNRKKPELEMFTLLNPGFYGVHEDHFINKRENESSVEDRDTHFDNVVENNDG